jgi:hypothetical protein
MTTSIEFLLLEAEMADAGEAGIGGRCCRVRW